MRKKKKRSYQLFKQVIQTAWGVFVWVTVEHTFVSVAGLDCSGDDEQ